MFSMFSATKLFFSLNQAIKKCKMTQKSIAGAIIPDAEAVRGRAKAFYFWKIRPFCLCEARAKASSGNPLQPLRP
jgi:hypothetical protein